VKLSLLALMALILSGFPSAAFAGPSGANPCATYLCGNYDPPAATESGYRYVFDGNAFARAPTSGTTEQGGQQYRADWTPVCNGNLAAGQVGGDSYCLQAALLCPPGEIRAWQVLTPVNPPGPSLPPTQMCLGASDVVTLADLRAALREQMEELLPKPAISLAPPNGGLVNLPVIVSTTEHGQEGFDITIPLPGRVNAAAVSYDWAFSDGGAASGPGRPYESGITPSQAPSYYLTHTYLGAGPASATVTVVWQGTFTIGGYTVELDPVTFTADVQFPIFEARSQLIAGNEY
jgi:hypothetical protein